MRELQRLLRSYSHVLEPWARVTASRMVQEVSRRDAAAWSRYANELGAELRSQLTTAPLGAALNHYMAQQVHYITSLPLDAAQRVHDLATGAIYSGARPEEIAREILRTSEVTRARANLIARTETGRVMTGLTKIRAEHVGSTHFRWVTSGDADVRKLHKKLNGTVHRWDDPPVAGERGERALPGSIYNCFPGDTVVNSDGCLGVVRAHYDGPMIEFFTGDATVRVTPNHELLTGTGWKTAGSIKVGEKFVHTASQRAHAGVTNVNDSATTFDQVFSASIVKRKSHTGTVNNFYDQVVDDQVEVVRTELYLALHSMTALLQGVSDQMVADADVRMLAVRIVRSDPQVIKTLRARCGDQLLSTALVGLRHSDKHTLRTAPDFDTSVSQQRVDRAARTDSRLRAQMSIANSERLRALTTEISGDDFFTRQLFEELWEPETDLFQVVVDRFRADVELTSGVDNRRSSSDQFVSVLKKSEIAFDGHVYTLDTVRGWYAVTAAQIPAKNCRCIALPILADEPLILGDLTDDEDALHLLSPPRSLGD